jgi:Transposase DDE domain
VDADLDTLATALYVRVDDALKDDLTLAPRRAKVSFRPKRSDAELITLAVLQALAGFVSETRWLRYARIHLRHLSPICPASPATTNVWLIDATPVECGRSRPTAERSDTAGWSGYGYVASHTRYFWGLRLHLICTPAGLPITFALTNPTTDEREIARDMLEAEPELLARRAGQTLIADKGYASAEYEGFLASHGARLLRPAFKNEHPRPGARLLKPLHQIIESVNDTLKGQLDLERHGGRTCNGVAARILQRVLALTAAIWHNDHTGQPVLRSLIATTTDPREFSHLEHHGNDGCNSVNEPTRNHANVDRAC